MATFSNECGRFYLLSHETDLRCLERVKEALVKLEEVHCICLDSPTCDDYRFLI